MDIENLGALIYLPGEKKIEKYDADCMEAFENIDDYWMKRQGLVFYPFDRSKQAFFFGKKPGENRVKDFDLSPNDSLSQIEYETSVYSSRTLSEKVNH